MRPGQPLLEGVPREGVRLAGTIGLLVIPFWSAVSAQETIPISARETAPISARETVPISPDKRPTWVVDGVPDSVWMLVEESWTTDDEDRKKEILERAETHARAAFEGHPDDAARRFAFVVVLASRADVEGGRTQVRTASEVHRELEAILEVDPKHARARHLLGRLYAGVRRSNWFTRWIATNLLGGGALKEATWKAAEEHLSFAEQQAPEVSGHHLQLAALYADTDRLELALQELEHVFRWPIVSPIERFVWDQTLEVKEEWEQKLIREVERGQGCRSVGPNRTGTCQRQWDTLRD